MSYSPEMFKTPSTQSPFILTPSEDIPFLPKFFIRRFAIDITNNYHRRTRRIFVVSVLCVPWPSSS